MEGKDKMATELTAGNTDIPHNADEAASWHKDTEDVIPDLEQLHKELLVVRNVA